MSKKINILGVYFNRVTMDEAVNSVLAFLNGKKCRSVFTANPEFVMIALDDSTFLKELNKGDLIVADGIGVVIGAKLINRPLPERVAGYDLVQNVFTEIKNTDKTVYFFGAKEGVAKKAAKVMRQTHKGLNIVGTRNGYFIKEDEDEIIAGINRLKPDMLLVGLSMVGQVDFIMRNKERLDVKVCIGVGGSFDAMAGVVKRAPNVFIKLNLEWFYRLLKQPSRLGRMLKLPVFLFEVIVSGKKYK